MLKNVKVLCLFVWGLVCCGFGGKLYSEEASYLKYVNEIIDDFALEMKIQYDLDCSGGGGCMPHQVEKVEVAFTSFQTADEKKARVIEVNAIRDLLSRINQHQKIRPFLKNYPFTTENVNVSISFKNQRGTWPLDGTIVHIFLARNKIFYNTAAMIHREPTPLFYTNKEGQVVKEMIGGGKDTSLIKHKNETFEEALEIVRTSGKLR